MRDTPFLFLKNDEENYFRVSENDVVRGKVQECVAYSSNYLNIYLKAELRVMSAQSGLKFPYY